ncbi:MAG: tetraacyldisaccharide 4'-kinase [Fimbriimonas sp.]
MHPGELWNSEAWSARLARGALLPLSGLYALGWEAYLATYRVGFKKARAPHSPVVCVGNLVSGGSGKSPVTLHVAEILRQMGRKVVVSASGYGSPRAEAATLAPEGPLSAREWGDEPAMIRWLLPDVPLVVGRRRVLAAQLVHEHHPNAVMLMDDGFQHLPLRKDLSLVLDDPNPPNRWCLPAGPYREGRWNRRRADLVLPDRFRIETEPVRFLRPDGAEVPRPPNPAALCALGQPERFFAAVGAPEPRIALPDHDPMDAGTLLERLPPDRPTVVTAKDWVKLRERADIGGREILIARHAVRIEPAADFRAWLASRLNERQTEGPSQ